MIPDAGAVCRLFATFGATIATVADDIISAFLQHVRQLAPTMTAERATRLEMELRAEFGGRDVYIRKTWPADRADRPGRRDRGRG